MMGAAISLLAGLVFPRRAWGGFVIKALIVAALVAGAGLAFWQWRADFRAGIVAQVEARVQRERDAAVIAAWSKASEMLAAKDQEKAAIIGAWSTALQAERLAAQAREMENATLPDSNTVSGVHGREIR